MSLENIRQKLLGGRIGTPAVEVEQVPLTIICQYTTPQNVPANTIVPVNMIIDPQKGSVTSYTVPPGERWIVKDFYVTSAPSKDAIISLIKNDYSTLLNTDPISTLTISNPAKPTYPAKEFVAGENISMKATVLVAGGTSAATDTFYVKVVRYKAK